VRGALPGNCRPDSGRATPRLEIIVVTPAVSYGVRQHDRLRRVEHLGSTMNWYLAVLKNYVGFSGRARRTEYWMFALFNFIIFVVLAILAAVTKSYFFWILYGIYGLGVLIPSLAVTWRRMQDTGRNGLWILLGLIPFVGGIILLIFMILPGTPGPNEFGPEPAAVPAAA
jgi:uncharacterized membrane protein YhaH (DUF805 family)